MREGVGKMDAPSALGLLIITYSRMINDDLFEPLT